MKRHALSVFLILSCLSSFAMGPKARSLTEEKNYLLSIYPISEVTSTENLSTETATEAITYYDGIGRPVEEIQRGLGASYNDIVSFHQYAFSPLEYFFSISHLDYTEILLKERLQLLYNSLPFHLSDNRYFLRNKSTKVIRSAR